MNRAELDLIGSRALADAFGDDDHPELYLREAHIVIEAIDPVIRANTPRVEIDRRLGGATTCRVWIGESLVFDGVEASPLLGKSTHG